jgi:hypothetical protein
MESISNHKTPLNLGDYLPLDIREKMYYIGNHQGLKEISDEKETR